MVLDEIFKLVNKLNISQKRLMDWALYNFMKEVVDPESFDADEMSEGDIEGLLDEVSKEVGVLVADQLFCGAVEFFLTNEYPDKEDETWNCIRYLLKKYNMQLKAGDKQYLKGLYNSYMSIYEVIEVEEGQGVTLCNMIEKDEESIKVKDVKGSKQLNKRDIIGARIVNNGNSFLLASAGYKLSKEVAEEVIEEITRIHGKMHEYFIKSGEMNGKDELLIKKMWAKEIIGGWYLRR